MFLELRVTLIRPSWGDLRDHIGLDVFVKELSLAHDFALKQLWALNGMSVLNEFGLGALVVDRYWLQRSFLDFWRYAVFAHFDLQAGALWVYLHVQRLRVLDQLLLALLVDKLLWNWRVRLLVRRPSGDDLFFLNDILHGRTLWLPFLLIFRQFVLRKETLRHSLWVKGLGRVDSWASLVQLSNEIVYRELRVCN